MKIASWVIRHKDTGMVIHETFNRFLAENVNKDPNFELEAVPILQHLQEINTEGTLARKVAFSSK